MEANVKRVLIAGTGSGCGKTTITCGILKALINKGLKVTAFKCGPDYIDTMFHKKISSVKSYNIDSFMVEEDYLKYLFVQNSIDCDIAIIEGVMGLYDGLADNSSRASSNDISIITNTPVILIVDCKSMALSVCAVIKGFKDFRKNNIKACILNNVSEMMFKSYKDMIEQNVNIDVIGYLPKNEEFEIKSRHLGLIMPNEIDNIQEKISKISMHIQANVDLDYILNISDKNKLEYNEVSINPICRGIKIGIAYDEAFCFYYEDNFRLLKDLGAEIVFFSPINDKILSNDINAIIIGGGYPELYAKKLSDNKTMIESIYQFIKNGGVCIAECGGFMYLHESFENYKMVGVIKGKCFMTQKLKRFGYITLKAKKNNILCKKGEEIKAHEFHYSDCDNNGDSFLATKVTGKNWECIVSDKNLFAGYPHINFWSNIDFIKNFIQKVIDNKNEVTRGN